MQHYFRNKFYSVFSFEFTVFYKGRLQHAATVSKIVSQQRRDHPHQDLSKSRVWILIKFNLDRTNIHECYDRGFYDRPVRARSAVLSSYRAVGSVVTRQLSTRLRKIIGKSVSQVARRYLRRNKFPRSFFRVRDRSTHDPLPEKTFYPLPQPLPFPSTDYFSKSSRFQTIQLPG